MLLKDPVKVEVTPSSTTVEIIQQSVYFTDKMNKQSLLLHLLKDENLESVLIFTQMKHAANKLSIQLCKAGIRAEAIHSNKSQDARQKALKNFKAKRTRVLVATDIAARGIDIDELSHVINYDLPNVPETYVHRIGRTGRAGAAGTAISFCDWSEKTLLTGIQKLIKKTIPAVKDHPFDIPFLHPNPNNQQQSQGNRFRKGRRNGKVFYQRAV
jgi:ATP-dependent RNA helicase RhlE